MQQIHSLELFVYFFIWITANIYTLYKLFASQTEILRNSTGLVPELNELRSGWDFLSRHQDVSDFEWNTWKFSFKISWHYYLLYYSISEVVRHMKPHLLHYWYLSSSVLFIFMNFGLRPLMMMLIKPLVYSTIIFFGGKKISVWFTSFILLLCYNFLKNSYWDFIDNEDVLDEEVYFVLVSIGWIQLRCISFCCDYIDKKEKASYVKYTEQQSIFLEDVVKMFSYVLYLPLVHSGPLILYDEYERSLTRCYQIPRKIKRFLCNMSILLTYIFLLEFALHYFYFLALQEQIQLLELLPTMALCGAGLWMGLEFHMKYVIAYGIGGTFASLDNIDTPPAPRCIARVHVYSQMWRYFDVGLHMFLIKYVYKPSFESLTMLPFMLSHAAQKFLSSLGTFLFIFLWHGTTKAILVWTLLNFTGIILETAAKEISETSVFKSFKKDILRTEGMEQRFIAMLCAPLLGLSAISNFYLFAGYDVGNLFFQSFSNPSLHNSVIVLLSLYSCCHVSMALKHVPARVFS